MRTPAPLPSDLPPAFAVASAGAVGVTPGRLRSGDLQAPFAGIRVRGDHLVDGTLRAACVVYAPRLKPWQFFSHETALALIGAPLPAWPHRPGLHVSAHRPAREPRLAGVAGHRLQLREPAWLVDAEGIPIEHPVRAWRQCGTLWRLDDLIVAADFLLSGDAPWADAVDLAHEIAVMGDVRDSLLRRAMREARAGVRSPRETTLRLALGRAGLPEPQVNWVLRDRDGRFVAELDIAYPQYRVAAEYDGRVHALDARQFEKDADRWDSIRSHGWEHVRILNHHMRGGGTEAVAKVRDALTRAGWHPGRS